MEATRLKLLETDVKVQWKLIEDIYSTIEERVRRGSLSDIVLLESLAYQLHNLYNAIEDLFKIVANAFENSVAEMGRWHIELLRRMRLEIPGIRPALVSDELYPLLDRLRAFRHVFRHAYGTCLEEDQVQIVLARARAARPLLKRDLERFLNRLGASLESGPA